MKHVLVKRNNFLSDIEYSNLTKNNKWIIKNVRKYIRPRFILYRHRTVFGGHGNVINKSITTINILNGTTTEEKI